MKQEKNKKENKAVFILYIIASLCYFISAVFGFIDGDDMAVTQLCLGACFLCLASVYYAKHKDKNKEEKEKKE